MFASSSRSDGPLYVAITLTDGHELKGKFIVPSGRALSEGLNGATSFIEIEPFGETRIFIAKSSLRSVAQIDIGPAPSLAPDPFSRD